MNDWDDATRYTIASLSEQIAELHRMQALGVDPTRVIVGELVQAPAEQPGPTWAHELRASLTETLVRPPGESASERVAAILAEAGFGLHDRLD